jgi:FkbM family methyltransferase
MPTKAMKPLQAAVLAYLRRFPVDYGKSLLKQRLISGAFRHGEVVHQTAEGSRFRLDLSDHVQREIFLHDVYERNTLNNLLKLVKPGSVVIDCGANIGAYSIPLARRIGSGTVISFEPHPGTISRLKANIALNGLQNVIAVPMGLSDAEEEVVLHGSSATTASAYKHHGSQDSVAIRCTTIDQYCSTNHVQRVDCLKIDIEGGEFKCLRGAEQTISRNPKLVIQIEIDSNCEHAGVSRQSLFSYIREMGFEAWQPRGFPFAMKRLTAIPREYADNVIFTRG